MGAMFVAYGDNIMMERQDQKDDTTVGKVVHSNDSSLKFGDIVLYDTYDAKEFNIGGGRKVDIVWRPKIRAILIHKE
jgi:co-chaperonin GroES (HSP10)